MGKVIFDTSMALDGFMAGANMRPGTELGDGREQLHQWAFEHLGAAHIQLEAIGVTQTNKTTHLRFRVVK